MASFNVRHEATHTHALDPSSNMQQQPGISTVGKLMWQWKAPSNRLITIIQKKIAYVFLKRLYFITHYAPAKEYRIKEILSWVYLWHAKSRLPQIKCNRLLCSIFFRNWWIIKKKNQIGILSKHLKCSCHSIILKRNKKRDQIQNLISITITNT